MMKKRKSLIVALSSLALIATSVGASGRQQRKFN